MASTVKVAIRRDLAVRQIQEVSAEIADTLGIDAPEMDFTTRWGTDWQHMSQLEAIAEFLETALPVIKAPVGFTEEIEGDGSGEALPDYGSMNRAELEAELAERGIPLDSIEGTGASGNVIKDDLVNALFDAEKDSD